MHPQKAFSMAQSIRNGNSAVSFNTAQHCSQNVFYIQNTGQNDSRNTRRIIMFISFFFLETVFHYVAPSGPQTHKPAVSACKED